MGYRSTSYDEVEDAFAQFEWDGDNQRWLFRRNGRGAPVVVTEEERELIEVTQRRGRVVLFVVFVAIYMVIASWIEAAFEDSRPEIADAALPIGMVAAFIALYAGSSLIDWIATRSFLDRLPVAPARTLAEIRRASASQTSWPGLVWTLAFAVLIMTVHWPPENVADWIWLAMIGALVGVILYQAFMKWKFSRS